MNNALVATYDTTTPSFRPSPRGTSGRVEKSPPKRSAFWKDCGASQEIPRLRSAPLGMTAQRPVISTPSTALGAGSAERSLGNDAPPCTSRGAVPVHRGMSVRRAESRGMRCTPALTHGVIHRQPLRG
jgi:hypothetical protein